MLLSFDHKSPTQLQTNLGKLMKKTMEKIKCRFLQTHTSPVPVKSLYDQRRQVKTAYFKN